MAKQAQALQELGQVKHVCMYDDVYEVLALL